MNMVSSMKAVDESELVAVDGGKSVLQAIIDFALSDKTQGAASGWGNGNAKNIVNCNGGCNGATFNMH